MEKYYTIIVLFCILKIIYEVNQMNKKSIEDIKVSKYTVESSNDLTISNILEKIILIFKVLIAKLNPANLLDKISATDLLKVFQFLAG